MYTESSCNNAVKTPPKNMHALVEKLKSEGEDFEFYPTTDEIIHVINSDIKNLDSIGGRYRAFYFNSFLDIGAGIGKVIAAVNKVHNIKAYAIEKAETLKNLIDQSVYMIGTDFMEQSLLDKYIDITFCNPPYSEYQEWTTKIIRESASPFIYLVIPARWVDSSDINAALQHRKAKYEIIGEFSFLDSEDRKARAIVNLVRVQMSREKDDAFDRFFAEEFKELHDKFRGGDPDGEEEEEEEEETTFKDLVLGDNYVKSLVNMYNAEILKIKTNYDLVGKLDVKLLKEFEITPGRIVSMLKEKLKNLKNVYWHELIGRMSEITEKLISKKRDELLKTLNENGHVDFTESNVYAVVLWVLRNADNYIEEQLLEVYSEFMSNANCINYKSNEKVYSNDRWRYNDENPTHRFLDFRLVVQNWGGIKIDWYNNRASEDKLTDSACDHIRDLLTVANNLGFKCDTADHRLYNWGRDCVKWYPGKTKQFEFRSEKEVNGWGVLFDIKAHKNGNIHIRLNQKFALALNVEYGRLKGWVHSKEEAATELMNDDAVHYFKTNYTLLDCNPFLQLPDNTQIDFPPSKLQQSLFGGRE